MTEIYDISMFAYSLPDIHFMCWEAEEWVEDEHCCQVVILTQLLVAHPGGGSKATPAPVPSLGPTITSESTVKMG